MNEKDEHQKQVIPCTKKMFQGEEKRWAIREKKMRNKNAENIRKGISFWEKGAWNCKINNKQKRAVRWGSHLGSGGLDLRRGGNPD